MARHRRDKGDRLYVNLGAAQVRRRLKGYGFGVRKDRAAIESKLPYPEELDVSAEFG